MCSTKEKSPTFPVAQLHSEYNCMSRLELLAAVQKIPLCSLIIFSGTMCTLLIPLSECRDVPQSHRSSDIFYAFCISYLKAPLKVFIYHMDLWVIASKLCINRSKSVLYYPPAIVKYFPLQLTWMGSLEWCVICTLTSTQTRFWEETHRRRRQIHRRGRM